MKRLNNLSLLVIMTIGVLFCGCSTPVPRPLRKMPVYAEPATPYDTSAKCFVYGSEDMRLIPLNLQIALSKCGYTVYSDYHYNKHIPEPPDYIIEVINWRTFTEEYLGSQRAYYAQIHVSVRRPGIVDPTTNGLVLSEPPRNFIAVAQSFIDEDELEAMRRDFFLKEAVNNLMLNPRFREALQTPPKHPLVSPGVVPTSASEGLKLCTEKEIIGTWKAESYLLSKSNNQPGQSRIHYEKIQTFKPNGICSYRVTLLPDRKLLTQEDFNYTIKDNVITFTKNGQPKGSNKITWRSNDSFDMTIGDLEIYKELMKGTSAIHVTCSQDAYDIVTSVLTYDRGITITQQQLPEHYTREK